MISSYTKQKETVCHLYFPLYLLVERLPSRRHTCALLLRGLLRWILMSLPGGWDVKDPVYFTAPSQTFGDGDKVIYGQRGEVVGLATLESNKGNGVAVQFRRLHGAH